MSDALQHLDQTAREALLRAKDHTRRTGILVDLQVQQLKLWPFAVFGHVEDAAIDPLDVNGKAVHYQLAVRRLPTRAALSKRGAVLGRWVRAMLGDDWEVFVRVRKAGRKTSREMSYVAKRLAPLEAAEAQPKTDLPQYEFADAITSFRRYEIRDRVKAQQAASTTLPPIKTRGEGT